MALLCAAFMISRDARPCSDTALVTSSAILRISPVLWTIDDIQSRPAIARFADYLVINPLYSLLGGWTDLVVRGNIPDTAIWLWAAGWAVAAVVIGGLFFMSREREFVVRL